MIPLSRKQEAYEQAQAARQLTKDIVGGLAIGAGLLVILFLS